MTILYDATSPVKSNRQSFGRGLLPSNPTYRDPVTLADRIEAAQFLNEGCTDYDVVSDAELEQAAGAALAQSRLDAGFIGFF